MSSPTVGLGAGDDQDLAALRGSPSRSSGDGVAQQRVDLARGDEPLDLVARRVERLRGVAAVGDQRGELALSSSARANCGVGAIASRRRDDLGAVLASRRRRACGRRARASAAARRCRRRRPPGAGTSPTRPGSRRAGWPRSAPAGRPRRARPGVASIAQRVDADLGAAEVEVVDRPIRRARDRGTARRAGPWGRSRITARSGSRASLAKWRAMTELLPPPWPPISAWPYLRSPGAIETGAALVVHEHARRGRGRSRPARSRGARSSAAARRA